ncbi:DUF4926 domain-containing protein [Lysobacter sp. Hz 25]|uniref:DUF4926 domain-containing protein n=1 Tax=Lysobacter sp. Hz 25 TaxID=3383698 RepID=UPI0038D37E68
MKSTFKEYDVVIATQTLSERIKKGTKGVILLILDAENGVYEAEFVDSLEVTLGVITVDAMSIEHA